jgi:hypothetical protein
MRLKESSIISTLIIYLLIFGSGVIALHYFTQNWPKYENQFMELGLLDTNQGTFSYFSNNESLININEKLDWNIYVHNHMDKDKNALIRVKLINSTNLAPNDFNHTFSPAHHIYEYNLFLLKEQKMILPFEWNISTVIKQDNMNLFTLVINENIVEAPVSNDVNGIYRIIFELWMYNETVDEYEFTWHDENETFSASLYIWFRLNNDI